MQQNGSFDYSGSVNQRQGSDFGFQVHNPTINQQQQHQQNFGGVGYQDININNANTNTYLMMNGPLSPNSSFATNNAGQYGGVMMMNNQQQQQQVGYMAAGGFNPMIGVGMSPTSPNGNAPISPSNQLKAQRRMHNPYSTDKTTRMVVGGGGGTPQSQRDLSSPSSPTMMGSQTFSNGALGGAPQTPQAHASNSPGGSGSYTNNPYKMMNVSNTNNTVAALNVVNAHVPLMENLMLPSSTVVIATNPVPAPLYINHSNNINTFGVSTTAPTLSLMSLKKPNTPPTELQYNQNDSSNASSINSASATMPPPPPASGSSNHHQNHHQQQQPPAAPLPTAGMSPSETYEYLLVRKDELTELSRTAQGSSMLQSAIKSGDQCTNLIWECFEPVLGDLMLDANAGYVVRVLLDTVPREASLKACERITEDQLLAFSLCVHSLHTRRLVQSIMETVDRNFLCTVLINQCAEVAKTQQGCIVMQRALDHCVEKNRTRLVAAIASNVAVFATDPFANYVIQYLLDTAPREEVIPLIWASIKGKVLELSCNKFASNVIEKFLILADQQSQHALIDELYNNDVNGLCRIMQDSFGNYIVQATIARSSFADVTFINEKLRPVLDMVPYGSKIAARLDRRLNNPNSGGDRSFGGERNFGEQRQHNNNNNHHHHHHQREGGNGERERQQHNNNNHHHHHGHNNHQQQMSVGIPAPASSRNNNNGGTQQQQQQRPYNQKGNYNNNQNGGSQYHGRQQQQQQQQEQQPQHIQVHTQPLLQQQQLFQNPGPIVVMQQQQQPQAPQQQQGYYGQQQQGYGNMYQHQQLYTGVTSSAPTPAW